MATTEEQLDRLAIKIRQELRRIEEQITYALEALAEGGTSDLEYAPINITTANTRLAEYVAVYNHIKKGY